MQRKPYGRFLRFSLRTFLIVATLVGGRIGVWVVRERSHARTQSVAAESLEEVQAEIYAKPDSIWTMLEPDAPGRVVGVAVRSREATDDNLEPLSDLTDLVWLNLNDTQVTDAGVARLVGLTKLERIRLDSTEVGDETMLHLSKLPKLRMLNLYNTRITDAGLVQLYALENLEEIHLLRTQLTDTGIAALQDAMPDLDIHVMQRVYRH